MSSILAGSAIVKEPAVMVGSFAVALHWNERAKGAVRIPSPTVYGVLRGNTFPFVLKRNDHRKLSAR